MITQNYLKECIFYCPSSGIFTWLERPRDHFKTSKGHNIQLAKYSKKEAGSDRFSDVSQTKYICISIDQRTYKSHRLAWLYFHGRMPAGDIDHIDGNGSNNAISNLRDVTASENSHNRPLAKSNKTGIMGVKRKDGAWYSFISHQRNEIYLGRHKSLFDACCARKSAELKYGFHENHGRKGQNDNQMQHHRL